MREMKESNIQWLGKIPQNWNLIKGKYLFALRTTRGNHKRLKLLSPTQQYGVISQDEYEKLSGMKAVKLKQDTDLSSLRTIHKGDYCISLRSFQGGFEYCNQEGVVSPAYQVFYPTVPISHAYYRLLFKNDGFIAEMNSFTMSLRDGKNIAFKDFGDSLIPYPNLQEQQAIADYLDAKCADIDALQQDLQAEIETLQAYKKSLITRAVTKGLEPHVEMKDSRVEWIGKIPKNWSTIRLCYLLKEVNNRSLDGKEESLSISQTLGVIPSSKINVPLEAASKIGQKIVQPGELVLNKLKAHLGVCFVSSYMGLVSPDYAVYRANSKVNPKILEYIFHTSACISEFKKYITGVGAGLSRLYTKDLFHIKVALPNREKQDEIVSILNRRCSEIDSIISSKQKQSEILSDYKKSLIYEVVTGKKEVPVHE